MKLVKVIIVTLALLFVVVLGACQKPSDSGTIVHGDNTITISNNTGGNVQAFIATRLQLANSGKTVVISGACNSACTIFYSLDNACLAPDAVLGFHGAHGAGPLNIVANTQMAAFYRAGIQREFIKDWYSYTSPLKYVTRQEAKALDSDVKFCEDL
jgi:hypothetical protein